MSTRSDSPLPNSWRWVQVHEVAEAVTGNTPPTADASNYGGGIPFIKPPQLVDALVSDVPESLSDRGAAKARVLPAGAVLVSCIGYLGKTGIAKAPCATNQQINALVFDRPISPEFGFYYAQTLGPWLASASSATTVAIVNKGKFETAPFPLAPPKEQTRIVAKLEELLSDLDAGVAELKAAQKKLSQYRQSLLKAAVEGALTREWREKRKPLTPNPSPSRGEGKEMESGAQLLQRILKERRARWEAKQFAKFKEQGKAPPKDWQDKYPEPVKPDTTNLSQLPESWVWASLDQLALTVRNGLSQKPSPEPQGYPILRINAVRPMKVDLNEVRYLSIDADEAKDYLLDEGDLLATRYNGTVDLLGVLGMVRGLVRPTVHPDKLIRIKPVLTETLGDWIEICAGVGNSRRHIISRVKTTAGQTGISGDDLKKMPIPLAPLSEQVSVIERVTIELQEALNQEKAVEVSIAQSTAQRKNILKAAFSGQLVPQDPNDEPASVLLERIRAERAKRNDGKIAKARKTRTTK